MILLLLTVITAAFNRADKRTKRQCAAPAVREKRVCRFHGGKSTGPKTEEGRKRCGLAKTVPGCETRAIRAARPGKMAELRELARLIKGW